MSVFVIFCIKDAVCGSFLAVYENKAFSAKRNIKTRLSIQKCRCEKIRFKKIELKMYFFGILSSISYIDCN